MPYSNVLLLLIASLCPLKSAKKPPASVSGEADLRQVIEPMVDKVCQLVAEFQKQRLTPTQACQLEQQLREIVRELGRLAAQWTYQQAEPAVETLPKHVCFEGMEYTRLNEKTPQNVWTLFGQVRLLRVGYRPTNKTGDATIFPLAMSLGSVHGATPALAERASWYLGNSGMTQSQTLERLKQDHGVCWGVKKLRQVTSVVSAAMAEQQHESQVEKLLALLKQASASTGKHKPVLSVGRDGITLGTRCQGGSVFEVATTGTLTVFDRRDRRLGTVYLAYTPEFGQKTMSTALTRLFEEVLRRWDGPGFRLCYVTDAGDNETAYYDKVLKRMKHPVTGTPLEWIRVVDYYHASERVWTMADLLFGKGQRATSWARKMQKWLLKPGGVNRVLHSAAALRDLYKLRGEKLRNFGKAYRYLRDRMQYMRYAEYKALGIPRGSGVTEAACKTVYTQRLKLSGMRWTRLGAQTILNLRVLQLSGIWQAAYAAVLEKFEEPQVRGQAGPNARSARNAA